MPSPDTITRLWDNPLRIHVGAPLGTLPTHFWNIFNNRHKSLYNKEWNIQRSKK